MTDLKMDLLERNATDQYPYLDSPKGTHPNFQLLSGNEIHGKMI